jgi:hypothetical protein
VTDVAGESRETTDLAQLRAENEALRQALSGQKSARSLRVRSVGAWVAGVIAVVGVVLDRGPSRLRRRATARNATKSK